MVSSVYTRTGIRCVAIRALRRLSPPSRRSRRQVINLTGGIGVGYLSMTRREIPDRWQERCSCSHGACGPSAFAIMCESHQKRPIGPWLQEKADFLDAWIANPVIIAQNYPSLAPGLFALD